MNAKPSASAPPGIHTESIRVNRTALFASLGPAPGPAVSELWYILHGQSMRAAAFLETARALEAPSRLLIAPEALNRHYEGEISASRNATVGATWMTREERESEIRDYVAYLDDLHALMTERFAGSPPPVTILGFSQGGATGVRWAAHGTVRIARLIVWASSLPPDVNYVELMARQRNPRVTYVAGTKDIYITPKVLGAQHAILSEAKVPFEAVSFEGGHRLDDEALRHVSRPDD
jgi:predicted esterase